MPFTKVSKSVLGCRYNFLDGLLPHFRRILDIVSSRDTGRTVLLIIHHVGSSTRLMWPPHLMWPLRLMRLCPRQRHVPGGAQIRAAVDGVVVLLSRQIGVAVEWHGCAAGQGVDGVPRSEDLDYLGVQGLVHVGDRRGAPAQRLGRAGQVPAPELLWRRHPRPPAPPRPRTARSASIPTNQHHNASETDGRMGTPRRANPS